MGAESIERIGLRRKPKQERSIQRLDLILAAAAKIIAQKGVSAMRMTELAVAAKVPIGSVYQYFPEKAAIVKALFDQHASAIQAKTAAMFSDVQSLEQALDLVCVTIDWYYESYRDDPVYLGVWMGTETDQDLLQLNIEHSGRVAGIFHDAVRRLAPDLCDEEMFARTYLFSHLIGAVIRLAAVSEETIARRMLGEWKRVIRASLFAAAAPSAAYGSGAGITTYSQITS
ncbi:TetR/AcrR family transcriptional regulator [Rhizobium bangladeshense]|uniref:TetR family transcriptional regulator n=1 Tax=Rhizobium bangladeshense TaxID=1138189 RepID=UPI001C8406AE|nr:TetR family transcriptional regulator [Rhizobium bangladeshense]MBX4919976.1 TetR/AcrR family transcriptional regulator [Rhizobium bangladeshense]